VHKVSRALNFESIRQSNSLKCQIQKVPWMVCRWLYRLAQYLVSLKHTVHEVANVKIFLGRIRSFR
jgi:hypothetical protein